MTKPRHLNPATPNVTLTGTIDAYGSIGTYFAQTFNAAVFGTATTNFTIHNEGFIETSGTTPNDAGLFLGGIGTVFNDGTIAGPEGIIIAGTMAGSQIFNTGLIAFSGQVGIDLTGAGAVQNSGAILGSGTQPSTDIGVALEDGGTVANTGTIAGYGGIVIDSFEPGQHNTANHIDNAGTIEASRAGISLYGYAVGYISNSGYISASVAEGILSRSSTPVYVYNYGTVNSRTAMLIRSGGVYNYNGLIEGVVGVVVENGDIVNTGTIDASATAILIEYANSNVAITNAGSIIGTGGIGVAPVSNAIATITNTGTILATGGYGITLSQGGTVTNTGLISAYNGNGIDAGGSAIINNLGTIISNQYAVSFSTSAASTLIIHAHSSIIGAVNGGNGNLVLAADRNTTGTFTAQLQTQLADFGTIVIDSDATWDFAGTLTETTALRNNGTIRENHTDKLTIDAAITGDGTIALTRKPLALDGAVAATQHIQFTAGAETLKLGDAAAMQGKIKNFAAGDTIAITTLPATGAYTDAFAHGILTISGANSFTLTFANPATFAHESFALTDAAGHLGITLTGAAAAPALTTPPSYAPSATRPETIAYQKLQAGWSTHQIANTAALNLVNLTLS